MDQLEGTCHVIAMCCDSCAGKRWPLHGLHHKLHLPQRLCEVLIPLTLPSISRARGAFLDGPKYSACRPHSTFTLRGWGSVDIQRHTVSFEIQSLTGDGGDSTIAPNLNHVQTRRAFHVPGPPSPFPYSYLRPMFRPQVQPPHLILRLRSQVHAIFEHSAVKMSFSAPD